MTGHRYGGMSAHHPFELASADGTDQLDIGAAMNEALHTAPTWLLVGEVRHPAGPGQTGVGE